MQASEYPTDMDISPVACTGASPPLVAGSTIQSLEEDLEVLLAISSPYPEQELQVQLVASIWEPVAAQAPVPSIWRPTVPVTAEAPVVAQAPVITEAPVEELEPTVTGDLMPYGNGPMPHVCNYLLWGCENYHMTQMYDGEWESSIRNKDGTWGIQYDDI
jgi:hypothetical protein